MIERLAHALEHIEELPEELQEELAEQIEHYQQITVQPIEHPQSFAGIWSDLPDDMEETLMRWRHESDPTPLMEDQLRWMDEQ